MTVNQADGREVVVREVKTRIRKRARTEVTPIPSIYWRELAPLAAQPAAAAQMPGFASISNTAYRERRFVFPPIPPLRDAFIIPQQFQETTTGQRFLLLCGR